MLRQCLITGRRLQLQGVRVSGTQLQAHGPMVSEEASELHATNGSSRSGLEEPRRHAPGGSMKLNGVRPLECQRRNAERGKQCTLNPKEFT